MTDQEYSLLLEQAEAVRSDKDALVDALYSSLQERDNCEYELSQPVPVTKYGKYGTITIHKPLAPKKERKVCVYGICQFLLEWEISFRATEHDG